MFGKGVCGFLNLHFLQEVFGFWINETLHLLIVSKVLLDTGVLVKLKALLGEIEFRLSASDVVDLDRSFVILATERASATWCVGGMASTCWIEVIVQRGLHNTGVV